MRRLAIAAVLLLIAVPAQAQPTPVQEYRESLMEGLGIHNDAVGAIVGGELTVSDHLLGHARSIQSIAAMLVDVFPEGSHDGTRASPDIWDEWETFVAKIQDLESAAAALVSAAEGGDAGTIAGAAEGVGAACRSCHQEFRLRRGR